MKALAVVLPPIRLPVALLTYGWFGPVIGANPAVWFGAGAGFLFISLVTETVLLVAMIVGAASARSSGAIHGWAAAIAGSAICYLGTVSVPSVMGMIESGLRSVPWLGVLLLNAGVFAIARHAWRATAGR